MLDLFADRAGSTFLGRGSGAQAARDHVRYLRSTQKLTAGAHTLRVSMVDPGIVIQRIVVDGAQKPAGPFGPREPESYFGPPDSLTVK